MIYDYDSWDHLLDPWKPELMPRLTAMPSRCLGVRNWPMRLQGGIQSQDQVHQLVKCFMYPTHNLREIDLKAPISG